ncbi:MAG: cytochrome c biogenesis CcdA family protein [Xanthobacteraceae bacterium]
MEALGGLGLGYLAGALSTLSPCVLPLLPIVLFGSLDRHPWGPVALAAGLAVSFAVTGTVLASIGFGIGVDPGLLRSGVALLLVVAGVILLAPPLQARLAYAAAPIASGAQSFVDRLQPSGLTGQVLLGAALGVVWSPCSGPTLGAAVGLAAQSGTMARAALVMAVFGLGAATPILALAYGSRHAIFARRERLAFISRIGKPLMGGALIVVGASVLSGLDKAIETALTAAMPGWLVALTTRL